MSAYIVDDATINKVVSYLYAHANGSWSIDFQQTKLHKIGYDLGSADSCRDMAQKMFDMNVAAVNARYGEGEAEDFRFTFLPASQIEVIKALKTWKYQCTEGEMPNLALYQAMAEMHRLLCIDFVEQTEEYEAASWG